MNQNEIPCLPNPQNDPFFRVIRIQSNKPNIAYDFLGTPPSGWSSIAKSWSQSLPKLKDLTDQFPQNPESFWKRESNTIYHWIPARIRLDDTIEQIKKKIIFAIGSTSSLDNLPISAYIELWIATPPDTLWKPTMTTQNANQEEKALSFLRLGERFDGFEGDVSIVQSKPQIDKTNFLTSSGKARTDLITTDERDRLLHDFFEELSKTIKNPVLYCHLITDALELKLPDNNEIRYGFYQKYWPFANLPPTDVLPKNDFQNIETYVKFDELLFQQIDSVPLATNKLYKNNCLIEKLEILINPQLNEPRIDLFKFWYIIHLDENTVFKRYRDPDEAPVYKFYKPSIKNRKIPSKMSFSWIGLATTSDARFREARIPESTLTIKRFLYDGTDGPRFATIHIKPEGSIVIDLSFQGKPAGGATPDEVHLALQAQIEWISNAHQSFDIRTDRRRSVSRTEPIPPGQYKFNPKTGEFTWGENIHLNGLQLLLHSPPKQSWVKPDYEKAFKKFIENFHFLMIPDIRQTAREISKQPTRKEGELVYRYTRISNYSNMEERYITIQETILEMPSADRQTVVKEIIRKLVENFSINEDLAFETFQEWDQIYGFTLATQAARLLRQTGFVIRFSPKRIQLHGIRDGWLGHRALSIIYRIWNQFITDDKLSNDFKKSAESYRKGEKIEEHIQTKSSLGVGTLTRTEIFQQPSNISFEEDFSSNFLSQVIANSESINRDILPETAIKKSILPVELHPESLGKDMGLDQYCVGDEADTEHQVCKDICMDDKYALRRLQLFDKALFAYTKANTGVKHSYSQACQKPSQPIVVAYDPATDSRIPPDTITYAVKYGSEPTRQFWYMCPEAWCPWEEIPIKYDLVRDKVQLRKIRGGEICRTALCPSCEENYKRETWLRLLPPDGEKHIYPGFNDKSIHPNDLCLPCCYSIDSRIKGKKHYSRMQKCLGEEAESNQADQGKDYLLGREKVPLPGDRFGVLTAPLQRFFDEKCESGYLLPGKKCIVRRGISSPEGQPLLDSITYIDRALKEKGPEWIHQNPILKKKGGSISMEEFINRFPREDFYTLAKGQLVRYFQPDPIPTEWRKLSATEFYRKIQDAAYDNFKQFLLEPSEKVPISILWDFLSRPGVLKPEGVNIFIIRGDQVLCPLGDEVDDLYREDRGSIFLLTNRDESSFEPIVHLENRGSLFYVNPLFPPGYPLADRLRSQLKKSCSSHQTVDWNRIRKDYAPNVPISIPKKPMATVKDLIKKISPKELVNFKEWTDSLHQVSGLITPEGYLLPTQSSRPSSNIQNAAIEIPIHTYLETLKAYEGYSKYFNEKGYEPARMSVSPKNPNQIIGIQLANEYVIPVKPIDKEKIASGKRLPETLSYLDPSVNRGLIQQLEIANDRVLSVSETAFLEETYQRLRFTLGRSLSENQQYRAEIMDIVKDSNLTTKEKEKKVYQVIIESLNGYVSKATSKPGFDLGGYEVPNIRELCHLTVPRRKTSAKNAKDMCEEVPHCQYQSGECLLFVPNFEKKGSKRTTRDILMKKLVKEVVLNPFRREEVVYNRIEDFLNKKKIEANDHEIFLSGEGITPYAKLIGEYRPSKRITSKFGMPIYQTAQPQLTPEDRERYRFHLGERSNTLMAFLPRSYALPGHWEERFGKGYVLRQADKDLDQFFLALRGTAEDVFEPGQKNNKSAEASAWTIWRYEPSKQNKQNKQKDLKPPISWQMNIADWKKWYREHLEMITRDDIFTFLDVLEEQYPKNKPHPFTKEIRKGIDAIDTENKEPSVRALSYLKLLWKVMANATVARNLQLWEDVQKYLDRGDYPISDFDFFMLNRFLGINVCLLEQRRSTTNHPSGYTWFQSGAENAPCWVVYLERGNVISVSVMEFQNHLLLPLQTFAQTTRHWIEKTLSGISKTDLWTKLKKPSPWAIGRKLQQI